MSSEASMRASDQDGDRATQVLREAYAVGRLTLDEFRQRAGAGCSARTWGELADLTADLPDSRGLVFSEFDVESYTRALSFTGRRGVSRAVVGTRAVVGMALIWLAIAAAAHVFSAVPLVFLAVFVVCAGRRS